MTIKTLLLDAWGIQLDAFTFYRHKYTARYFINGPIRVLNIGTGGGMETLRLLRRGNLVTTVEYDPHTAARTRERIERNGFAARHTGLVGHILDVDVEGPFHMIVMCEVLEHILDDRAVLKKLSQLLVPGGRLVLSTPTSLNGQLPGDAVSLVEDGGHVRTGYEGPELDLMLQAEGLLCLKRLYYANPLVQCMLRGERLFRSNAAVRPVGIALSFLCRPVVPLLDLFVWQPFCQLTIATKPAINWLFK